MVFTKEEYSAKYEEMYALLLQNINIFKEIIEDERARIDKMSNEDITK